MEEDEEWELEKLGLGDQWRWEGPAGWCCGPHCAEGLGEAESFPTGHAASGHGASPPGTPSFWSERWAGPRCPLGRQSHWAGDQGV